MRLAPPPQHVGYWAREPEAALGGAPHPPSCDLTMLAAGDPAPDFTLARLDGGDWRLEDETAEGPLLLTFI
ncbi:MAG: hypothetical protein IIC36_12925, partial [Gemmatimonadetes bacterium]|nr:hypothetical protein [Gemmatimonadota bacterium]